MQERWKSVARAAAENAFGAQAPHDNARPAEPVGAKTARSVRSPMQSDVDRFRTLQAQRQISTYFLHRSLSTDQRNRRALEWWREALRRSEAEPESD